MSIDKLLIKKILIATTIGGGIAGGGYNLVQYALDSNKKVQIIPDAIEKNAKDLQPDLAFAAQFENNKIKDDVIADEGSKKILAEGKPKNINEENKNKTDKIPTNVVTNNTNTEVLVSSEFAPSETKLVKPDIRTVLVNSENRNEKELANQSHDNPVAALQNTNLNNVPKNAASAPENELKMEKRSKGSLLLAANGAITSLKGRDVSIGAVDYQIKAGTRLLALLPDGLTITSGGAQPTSLSIIGPLNDFKFPSGYIITATATLNPSEDKIYIEANLCASRNTKIRSVPCKGTIKDIRGYTGLSGEIYNHSFWSAAVAFAGATLAAIPLSQITKSATISGTIENVSISNSILTAVAAGVQSVTASIQKGFDKSGTQITIPQDSIVQILFTQDTIL